MRGFWSPEVSCHEGTLNIPVLVFWLWIVCSFQNFCLPPVFHVLYKCPPFFCIYLRFLYLRSCFHVWIHGRFRRAPQLGHFCISRWTQHTLLSDLILIKPLKASVSHSFGFGLTFVYQLIVYCPNCTRKVLVEDSIIGPKFWLPCSEWYIHKLAMFLGVWIGPHDFFWPMEMSHYYVKKRQKKMPAQISSCLGFGDTPLSLLSELLKEHRWNIPDVNWSLGPSYRQEQRGWDSSTPTILFRIQKGGHAAEVLWPRCHNRVLTNSFWGNWHTFSTSGFFSRCLVYNIHPHLCPNK